MPLQETGHQTPRALPSLRRIGWLQLRSCIKAILNIIIPFRSKTTEGVSPPLLIWMPIKKETTSLKRVCKRPVATRSRQTIQGGNRALKRCRRHSPSRSLAGIHSRRCLIHRTRRLAKSSRPAAEEQYTLTTPVATQERPHLEPRAST